MNSLVKWLKYWDDHPEVRPTEAKRSSMGGFQPTSIDYRARFADDMAKQDMLQPRQPDVYDLSQQANAAADARRKMMQAESDGMTQQANSLKAIMNPHAAEDRAYLNASRRQALQAQQGYMEDPQTQQRNAAEDRAYLNASRHQALQAGAPGARNTAEDPRNSALRDQVRNYLSVVMGRLR